MAAPSVVDISVTLPGGASVEVQGLVSDCIDDVRTLLSQHPATCHQTSFSLCHKVRGPNLKPSTDVAALKPLELEMVEEPYMDASSAMTQVRRLAELVAPYNSSVRVVPPTKLIRNCDFFSVIVLFSPPPPFSLSLSLSRRGEEKRRQPPHMYIHTFLYSCMCQFFSLPLFR